MVPIRPESPPHAQHIVERTPEYVQFIARLREYHQKRGTSFDPEPKVGLVHLDMLKVFKHIVANGGYDKVSDEKLAWRRMAAELGIWSTNEASTAFSLKEKFYKNLAAYEISAIHGREPPPKDILEDVTAKGAGLLTRTRANFRGTKRESAAATDLSASVADDSVPRERAPVDTPGSSGRATRGLREAPPQRSFFQPESTPTRVTPKASPAHAHSLPAMSNPNAAPLPGFPAHAHTRQIVPPMPVPQHRPPRGASVVFTPPNSANVSSVVTAFEPRFDVPIPVRQVETPSSNPAEFQRRKMLIRSGHDPSRAALSKFFEGPNIYTRCLNALRSKIPSEQAFALYHLVKISFERGDRFKFESFPGLADGLVEKALEVGGLFYRVKWQISWNEPDVDDIGTLNGIDGTEDILERIHVLQPIPSYDLIQAADFSDDMVLINEAMLTIRNMVTLPENALYMSSFPPLKDLLCIILNLPHQETVVEIKHVALDVAEHLTPYLTLASTDPLYKSLLLQLGSNDRGIILTALRAVDRISMNLEATNELPEVSPQILQSISEWLLLDDNELIDACLDFLYQYTAVVSNIDALIQSVSPDHLVGHLVRLLTHSGRKVVQQFVVEPEKRLQARSEIAPVPADLLQELLKLDDSSRVQQWVVCLFEEDDQAFVTQLSIWQAYQTTFAAVVKATGQGQISPTDFIRVSQAVYKGTKADVLRDPAAPQKYIIHGLRPRLRPLSVTGSEYQRCLWATDSGRLNEKCGQFFLHPRDLWNHVLLAHLGELRDNSGYQNKEMDCVCRWAECTKFSTPTRLNFYAFSRHISMHASSLWPPKSADGSPKKPSRQWLVPAKTMAVTFEETATHRDEKNPSAPPQAAGIPLSAVLVLRNIARNIGKSAAEVELLRCNEKLGQKGGWNERLFRSLLPRLFDILAENKAMAPHISSLLDFIHQDPQLESEVLDPPPQF